LVAHKNSANLRWEIWIPGKGGMITSENPVKESMDVRFLKAEKEYQVDEFG